MSKKKVGVIVAALVLVIAAIIVKTMKFYSYSTINGTSTITAEDKQVTFNVCGNFDIIHINIKDYSKDRMNYNIISPSGECVGQGKLIDSNDYIGKCQDGNWKIEFNNESDRSIDYTVWTGNTSESDVLS